MFILSVSVSTYAQNGCISGDCQNGIGKFYWSEEEWYEGNYRGGAFEGQGIYYYENGDKYVGNWQSGNREGQGAYFFSNGNFYMGQWAYDAENGYGTLHFAEGDMYVGHWVDGKRDGMGTFYFADGRCMKDATYLEDEIVGGTGTYYELCPDLDMAYGIKPDSVAGTESISVDVIDEDSFGLPVMINGVHKISSVYKANETDVLISPDVAWMLIRTGSVFSKDFLPGTEYIFSNGDKAQSSTINIRKLEVGHYVIKNINARINDSVGAPLVFGKHVADRLFGTFDIDSQSNKLILTQD